MDNVKVLILAGGHSSRMGSPKHLLQIARRPLYVHLVRAICQAVPETSQIHVSLARRSTLDEPLQDGKLVIADLTSKEDNTVELITILDEQEQDFGPAAGLLAAHHHDGLATWLVIACDFPFLNSGAVKQLLENFEPPVTCFKNTEGFSEPLLAIWSPQALAELEKNVEAGKTGPNYTVKRQDAKLIVPKTEEWLVNANTKEEWEAAKMRLEELHPDSAS